MLFILAVKKANEETLQMKLKLDIKPDTYKQRGFFGKSIPVHKLHIDLQLTEQEWATIESAGIMEQYFTTQDDPTGGDPELMKAQFPDTDGRVPIRFMHLRKTGKIEVIYLTRPAAMAALEQTKNAMINIKAMLEQADDPSASSFEL